jgi:cell division protease FtsH
VDEEIKRIVEECLSQARALLEANREKLEALARALLAEESLDEGEILRVTGLPPKSTVPQPAVAASRASQAPAP